MRERLNVAESEIVGALTEFRSVLREGGANNGTTAGVSLSDIMSLAARFTKPEPIMAFQGTAEQLALAIQAERPPVNPLLWSIKPPDAFCGLDVVEEDGWTYIGTTKQLADARKRWGSLSDARLASESAEFSD